MPCYVCCAVLSERLCAPDESVCYYGRPKGLVDVSADKISLTRLHTGDCVVKGVNNTLGYTRVINPERAGGTLSASSEEIGTVHRRRATYDSGSISCPDYSIQLRG